MNDTPARQIVAAQRKADLELAGGLEIIVDLRPVEAAFFETVNEIQQGVIRKRMAEDRLTHISALPLAAKKFVYDAIRRLHTESEWQHRIRPLDLLSARQLLTLGEQPFTFEVRKRLSSGIFVVLPRSSHALSVERLSLRFLPDGLVYWTKLREEADQLGPLPGWP